MINKSQYYKVIRLPIFLEAPRWRVLSPDARTSNAGTPPGSYNLIVRGTLKSGTAVLVHIGGADAGSEARLRLPGLSRESGGAAIRGFP